MFRNIFSISYVLFNLKYTHSLGVMCYVTVKRIHVWYGPKTAKWDKIYWSCINHVLTHKYADVSFTSFHNVLWIYLRFLSKDDVLSKRLRQHIQPNIYSPAERNKTLRTSILGCFSNNTLKKNEKHNPFRNWGHLEGIYPDGEDDLTSLAWVAIDTCL